MSPINLLEGANMILLIIAIPRIQTCDTYVFSGFSFLSKCPLAVFPATGCLLELCGNVFTTGTSTFEYGIRETAFTCPGWPDTSDLIATEYFSSAGEKN